MIIKNISIKNLKSFGNDPQEINLTNEGNLILLSGKNGAGKSSIIDSFDYVLFNKVKGRKSKKLKLSSLSNRINGDLEVGIEFISNDGTEIKIIRGHNPSKLKLFENGIENLRAGKAKIDALIEGYVGLDYETFKGFISMSINDFKNFISLSNEDKKLLLDKMFNLEVIGTLNKILNGLISENKKELDTLDREINILTENIDNINFSIEKVKKSKKDNLDDKIDSIKKEIESNKLPFNEIKNKLILIKEKQVKFSDKISEERSQLIEINSEVKLIDRQLELFNSDKCPTCQSDLSSDFHRGLKESYVSKKDKFVEVSNEIKKRGLSLKEKQVKLDTIYEKWNNKYMELSSSLKSFKREYDDLILKKKDNVVDTDLEEFYNSIDISKKKLSSIENNKSESEDKTIYHKHIKSILSENGVKKSIIQNIIDPINFFISENIQKMHLPFEVTLDDTFSAEVTSFGESIDVDSLSTGENKIINICILLGYLRLIRTKKQMNVLFLDEVFSSVDVERINDVTRLLRDLANQSKINIFLVHHSLLDDMNFDKIYEVRKDVFSYIEEKDNGDG